MNKKDLKLKIYEFDFAIHELSLYLDSHPTSKKAMLLLNEYRAKRAEAINLYEEKYGPYIVTSCDVPTGECWSWLKGPWPWENDFWEE